VVVGTLSLQLRLEGCFSLEDKRRILRSLIDRTRRDFQVAISEVDDMDLWRSSVVGVAYVSNDAHHVESVLQHVVEAFDACPDLALEGEIRTIERQ